MTGLQQALAEAKDKRVLDLGCAEGLIAAEFQKAGAEVTGVECNPETVEIAKKQARGCRILLGNLNHYELPKGPWHIVLALAILHKLKDPAAFISQIADLNPELVVVRLPKGSIGRVVTKTYATACDMNAEFQAHEFTLSESIPGPHGEIVQYWR